MKKQKKMVLVLLLVAVGAASVGIYQYVNDHQKVQDDTIYMESPVISTCSNGEEADLRIRLLCNSATYQIQNYAVETSTADVQASITDVAQAIENKDGSIVYNFDLTLTVPNDESVFDLTIYVNGDPYDVKDIHHMNYNVESTTNGLEFLLQSSYVSDGKEQTFINEIKYDTEDISNREYHVLGEDIVSVEEVNEHQVNVTTVNTKPAIVGYTYTKDDTNYCISNSYHTEALDQKK